MMKAAIAPENLFWTPSSRSIISSARFSASSLIDASGWAMLVKSTHHGQELDLEVQGRIRRDHATPRAALAIGRGGGTDEPPPSPRLPPLHPPGPRAGDAVVAEIPPAPS